MPIGTSTGAYYANMVDMLSQQPPQTEDHNVINPFNTPGLQTEDKNEYNAQEKSEEIQNKDNVIHDISFKGNVNKALEPITSYPEVYSSMNKAARNKMSRGMEELRHGGLNGIFDTITGGLSYINSPIEAAVDTTLGKPLQDLTGIPKEMTDFTVESFLPGYGIEEIKDMALMRKVKEIEPALEHFGKEVTKKLPDLTANTEDENE